MINIVQVTDRLVFHMFRCDRILWHGDGIAQLSYFRGESKFSDHRPVCGTFIVEVEMLDGKSKRRSSNTNIRIGAEELLPTSKHNKSPVTHTCIATTNYYSRYDTAGART